MMIDQILDDLIRREGGYVHDPVDRGGPTKYGITQRTLRAWRGQAVTAEDVRRLTTAEARAIYRRRYVDDPGFARLPDPLRAQVVDNGVLSGPRQAVKDLQRAIGGVTVDGQLGPKTRAALRRRGVRAVHARLLQVRAARIGRLVQRAPARCDSCAGGSRASLPSRRTWHDAIGEAERGQRGDGGCRWRVDRRRGRLLHVCGVGAGRLDRCGGFGRRALPHAGLHRSTRI